MEYAIEELLFAVLVGEGVRGSCSEEEREAEVSVGGVVDVVESVEGEGGGWV